MRTDLFAGMLARHKLLVYGHSMTEERRHIGADAKQAALLEVGGRLRRARMAKGIPQRIAAQLADTSTQTIRNWEAGRHEPDPNAVARLARYYGVSPESILYGDGSQPSQPMHTSLRYNRLLIDPEKMEQARREADMARSAVEKVTGISVAAIGRYERGEANPRADTLETLANVYNKPLEWFTPRGYFTPEERSLLNLPPDGGAVGRQPEDEPVAVVLLALENAKPDLTIENARTIAEFIRFTHSREISPRRRRELYG